MAISEGHVKPTMRTGAVPMAAVAIVALLLAACGGGNGGNGEVTNVIRVAFANETDSDATIQLNDSEPTVVESCKGGVFIFDLPATDWVVTVNGETAVDSLELEPTHLDSNLVANLWLHEDGTLETERVLPGSNIQAPASLSICT